MKFRSLAAGALLFLVVAAPPPCAAIPTHTSDRFGFSTFREESGRMTVFADGYPASVAPNSSYIPIPIAVAMTRPGKTARFRPESFTLIDADGHAIPAATYREVTTKYDRLTVDRSLLNERPMAIAETITDLRQVPARFYPAGGRGTRTPEVELASSTWFTDVVYFPRPPSGVHGVMTLRVEVAGEPPVDVRFVATAKDLAER